jgi:hypothetical protein
MGMTIAEKILAAHSGRARVRPGEFILAEVDPAAGRITNLSRKEDYPCQPLAQFMIELVRQGGLLNLIKGGAWT